MSHVRPDSTYSNQDANQLQQPAHPLCNKSPLRCAEKSGPQKYREFGAISCVRGSGKADMSRRGTGAIHLRQTALGNFCDKVTESGALCGVPRLEARSAATFPEDSLPPQENDSNVEDVISETSQRMTGRMKEIPDDTWGRSHTQSFLPDPNTQLSRREYYQPIYIPSYPPGGGFWVELDPGERWVTVATGLPETEVQDKSIRTSFDFPFYGHPIRNVSIAMEGFLSIGSLLMESMASTQYIAPLMANFDATLDPMSAVRYRDNDLTCWQNGDDVLETVAPSLNHLRQLWVTVGAKRRGWNLVRLLPNFSQPWLVGGLGSTLTVEWFRVRLEDNVDAGSFTFQVTLCSDGRIIFVYKEVPIPTSRIDDSSYPVRVGISDAYTVDILLLPIANVHRKTVYEYHTLDLQLQKVKSRSAFLLSPLPTCSLFTDCWSCLSGRIGFQCGWCAAVKMCSDGYDRKRQQWVDAGCDQEAVTKKCEEETLPPETLTTSSKPKEPPPPPPPKALDVSYTGRDEVEEAGLRGGLEAGTRDDLSAGTRDNLDGPLQVVNPKSSRVQNIEKIKDSKSSVKMADAGEPSQVVRRFRSAQALETEVIIGILVAVVIVVVAIAWIIHAYSRRSTPELVVVEVVAPTRPTLDRGVQPAPETPLKCTKTFPTIPSADNITTQQYVTTPESGACMELVPGWDPTDALVIR
ncbi:Plexin domain-containing protein 2 [Branchiostoma belcheri]|nr:Plexin domain-containing protein 2 [Branchiostoma belcheri]